MDEILASIRRIIESGDERPDPTPPARGRPDRTTLVERLDAQDSANLVARLSPEVETAFLPGDEDDLAAHLRREIEADGLMHVSKDGQDETQGADEARQAREAVVSETAAASLDASAEATAPAVRELRSHDGSGDAAESAASDAGDRAATGPDVKGDRARAADVPFVAANSDSRRMQDFRSAVLDDLTDGGQLDAGASLVSGRTGELVGASFDELARAIREGELRSLEDMAQELLRPMLQDWLDDNLPKLVERLVREEIERVARGGRR